MPLRMRPCSAGCTASCAATYTARGCATIDGVLYCNDGDWVENCTALVEHMNGRLAIWSWAHAAQSIARRELVDVAA